MVFSSMHPDIDECSRNASECLSNSTCINIEGNYTCPCNNGFAGDGYTGCESKLCFLSLNWDNSLYITLDINECEDGTHNCDRNALCTDNVGSFACTCVFGYTGTGEQCGECDLVEASPACT